MSRNQDVERAAIKADFMRAAGWGAAVLNPLAGDASNRRYERAASGPGGAHAVLMDAPASRGEDIAPFVALSGLLRASGLSAPEIYHADLQSGFALIEDLGDDLYARVAAMDPALEAPIYEAAVDLLAALRTAPPVRRAVGFGASYEIPDYDGATLLREARLAIDWWTPAASGAPASKDMAEEFSGLIADTCAPVARDRRVVVMRDYHAENLLWLPERSGHARVGLLDYQDALIGAPAYDLVSLLEDARRDVPPALAEAMITRYLSRAAEEDEAAFRRDYAVLGAQRNLKIVGIFARLWLRDGKAGYLDLIPRVWAHLRRDLSHPDLAQLRTFVERNIPPPDAAALARVREAKS